MYVLYILIEITYMTANFVPWLQGKGYERLQSNVSMPIKKGRLMYVSMETKTDHEANGEPLPPFVDSG